MISYFKELGKIICSPVNQNIFSLFNGFSNSKIRAVSISHLWRAMAAIRFSFSVHSILIAQSRLECIGVFIVYMSTVSNIKITSSCVQIVNRKSSVYTIAIFIARLCTTLHKLVLRKVVIREFRIPWSNIYSNVWFFTSAFDTVNLSREIVGTEKTRLFLRVVNCDENNETLSVHLHVIHSSCKRILNREKLICYLNKLQEIAKTCTKQMLYSRIPKI